jgi:hypothetical protein
VLSLSFQAPLPQRCRRTSLEVNAFYYLLYADQLLQFTHVIRSVASSRINHGIHQYNPVLIVGEIIADISCALSSAVCIGRPKSVPIVGFRGRYRYKRYRGGFGV